jgi:hypothetical protein
LQCEPPHTESRCEGLKGSGQSYPGHGIDVHCSRTNDNGVNWVYARNTTTGKAGWARYDAVYTSGSVLPPSCGPW